jgi:nucleoside-diphosphate-sugar epimerase
LVPALVRQVANGRVTLLTHATRDLLDVDDMVRIVLEMLQYGVRDRLLNVASGVSTAVADLVVEISALLNVRPSIEYIDRGDRQAFSIDSARTAFPGYPRFAERYPFDVLARRVPEIARTIRAEAAGGPEHALASRATIGAEAGEADGTV